MKDSALTSENMKNALWDTLQGIKNNSIMPGQGDAIAAQAREILRTINTQLRVVSQSNRPVPTKVIDFAEQ